MIDPSFLRFRKIPGGYEIDDVFTSESQRRQGVAKMLLQFLLKSIGPNEFIWLEVHQLNTPARRLYGSLGFREVGQRANYYSDGGTAILCEYNLEYNSLPLGVDSDT